MAEWDAHLYSKFERERTLPARDLCAAIALERAERIIDIGCGIGNSTAVLKARYPDARVTGADLSESMLAAARQSHPELDFIRFDASKDFGRLESGYDIVFSNACIQWIPDHPVLLRNMLGALKAGGVLAVQTPMIDDEPIHRIITEIAASARWRARFPQQQTFHNLTQEQYFDELAAISSDFSVWQTTYCHRMPSHRHILDWYKSTGLRPYLSLLNAADAAAFEAEVLAGVTAAYPIQANGEIIFRFPRFFFTAVK